MKVSLIAILISFILICTTDLSIAAEKQAIPQQTSIQLKWKHQFQFSGYYMAKEKGYYSDSGLNVKILEGGPQLNAIEQVLSNQAQFGVAGSEILLSRAKDKELVVLAPIIQHSIRAIFARNDKGINSIHDLAGKKIMLNKSEMAEFQAMFLNEGMDISAITVINKDNTAIQNFLLGQIDGMNGSIANQPYLFKQQAINTTVIRPINYGIDFYGDVLFTQQSIIDKNPELVTAFKLASLKGWQYAFENPEETISTILQHYPSNKTRQQLFFEYEILRDLIRPKLVQMGHNNPQRWQHIMETYQRLGLLTKDYSLDGLIYSPKKALSKYAIDFILWAVLPLFILLTVSVIWSWSLRKLVMLRTIELEQEISEHELAKKALQKSNLVLASTIESPSNIIIFALDTNFNYLSFNSAHVEEMKKVYDADIKLGEYILAYIPRGEDRVAAEKNYKRVLNGERFVRVEKQGESSNRLWYELIFNPIIDECNQVKGLTVFCTDITERKYTEKALLESEERWQFALEGNRDGVWDWNLLSNKVLYSRRLIEMLGFEEEEFGNSIDEWKTRVHPDDLEQVLVNVDQHFNHVTPFYQNEHRMLCKDGSYKWILDRGKVVTWADDHRPQRMIGTHSDITEQKIAKEALELSEELFRTMFEEAPLGVALIDSLTGHMYQVNSRFSEIAGRSREEVCTLDWMSITHPDDVQEDLDNMALLNAGIIPGFNMIKRYLHPDGVCVWVNMTIAPMTVADKNYPRHLCMIEDITEQKETEEALRRAQKMEAMGNLTGGIAHDFNNLLAIVQGNLEILDRELPTNEKLHKRVNAALAGVHRGADITKKLLKFSRPKVTTPTILSLNETIADMEVLIAKSVMKRCSIQLRLTDALWLCKVNQGDFQDALLNLVINARDAMTGGGSVLIETANKCLDADYAKLNPEAEAGEYVQISVSDTGCGMSHKILEQVFEPFFTTKEMGEGTGLGLSMVYGFIKRSQGHIKLYSEVGHGTTVHLYLPRALQEGAIAVVPKITEQVVLPQGHETVLVVDDEEALLELASHFLLELGYKVLRATCGSEALEVLSAQKGAVDLMFSDIVMPGGMDGFALATKVVELYPEMSVLLTSGFSDKAVRLNGLARHHVKLLDKPYSKQELALEVRRTLDSKNAEDNNI